MADDPMEPETRRAQPGPAATGEDIGGNTEPRDYWGLAYDGLQEDVKELVSSLKRRFDKKTDEAIDKLRKATRDVMMQRKLLEIKENHRRLDVNAKGDLQRLSLRTKKKLDDEAVRSISTFHDHCMNNGDHDASGEDFTSVNELLQLCREGQEIAKAKEWELKFLNKTVVVAELWGKLIDKVDKLRPVIDVPMSSQSAVNTAWSVVKVLLQFAVQGEKELGAALSGIGVAIEAMQTFTVFDRQIQEIRRGNAVDKEAHIEVFESCLVSAYCRILKFFAEAADLSAKSRGGVYWHAFWSAGGIDGFEKDILKLKMSLFQDSTMQNLINHTAFARQTINLLELLRGDLERVDLSRDTATQRLNQLEQSISDQIEERKQLETDHDLAASRENILGWWSDSKVEDHHAESKRLRVANTGDWVFGCQGYKDWKKADGSRLLWINGIPGAGKTVLMSRFIDFYLALRQNQDIDVFQFAYFYCKQDLKGRRFSHNIFRSFIRQLADAYHPLPEKLRQVSEAKNRLSSLSVQVTDVEYRELLRELIPRTGETILVLDALDECIGDESQPTNRNKEIASVLDMFEDLLRSGLPVKIVMASRYDKDIALRCSDKQMIELSQARNQDDILKMVRSYIDMYNEKTGQENEHVVRNAQILSRRPRLKPKIGEELRNKMIEVFTDKSQGKFQWASMHIQHLLGGDFLGSREMKRELGRLPPGLTESYRGVFERIKKQPGRKPEIATRVFCWLLAFKGSCDQTPLIAAACQWLEDEPDPVEASEDDILTACQNLVVTDGSVFRFSHLSVQEYFEQHDLAKNCHFDVVLVCTSMVFRYNIRDRAVRRWTESWSNEMGLSAVDDSIYQLYELWEFAVHQWHIHFDNIKEEQKQMIRAIVLGENSASDDTSSVDWKIWQGLRATVIMDTWRAYLRSENTWESRSTTILPLQPGPKTQNTDQKFPGALVAMQSIGVGLLWKTRHLLRNPGAGRRRFDGFWPAPHIHHSFGEEEETESEPQEGESVTQLQEDEPDSRSPGEEEETASELREERDPLLERYRLLEQIWKKKFNRDSTDNVPILLLDRIYSYYGDYTFLPFVEERWRLSVDCFARSTQIIPPESRAGRWRSHEVETRGRRVDQYSLLGGDWPVTFEEQWSTLFPVSESLPVDNPTEVGEVKTLLMMLTYLEQGKSNEDVQELDVLNRIFVNMIGDPYNFKCLEELARLTLLLICAKCSYFGLRATSDEEYYISLLLETFPDAPRVRYRHLCPAIDFLDWSSVLVNAVGSFETKLVELLELLISHGAGVNAVTSTGSPLTLAAVDGRVDVMRLLISHGADVNGVTPVGSPMISAVVNGRVDAMRLLISHDADINAVTPRGSPLSQAVVNGMVEATKLLLEEGANACAEWPEKAHGSALLACCDKKGAEIASMLLDVPGIDINIVSEVGDYATPLIAGCANGLVAVVKKLLLKGARVNESVRTGVYPTALFAAADAVSVRAVRLLLKRGAWEVPQAARGEWRRGVREKRSETGYTDYSLAEWMILALVRGDPDEREDDNPWGPRGEDATIESVSDEGVPSENYPTEANVNRAHNSALETQDEDNPAETIPAIIIDLCRRMPLDPRGTSRELIATFGFSDYKAPEALEKGFKNLVEKTGRRDWPTIRAAWYEFLDLAEEIEDKPSYLLACRLAEADVKSVKRVLTDIEMAPYSDEEDGDED